MPASASAATLVRERRKHSNNAFFHNRTSSKQQRRISKIKKKETNAAHRIANPALNFRRISVCQTIPSLSIGNCATACHESVSIFALHILWEGCAGTGAGTGRDQRRVGGHTARGAGAGDGTGAIPRSRRTASFGSRCKSLMRRAFWATLFMRLEGPSVCFLYFNDDGLRLSSTVNMYCRAAIRRVEVPENSLTGAEKSHIMNVTYL